MTAEIVIMNREAVAMAADSMVTVGATKVFDTATKLHMLAPGYSIGVMIFNSANFMDLPWEVVIKEYRNDLLSRQRRFSKLADCANDFIAFLIANHHKLSTYPQQRNHIGNHLSSFLREVTDNLILSFRAEISKKGPKLTSSQLDHLIEVTIKMFSEQLDSFPDAFEPSQQEEFRQCFEEKFGKERDALITEYFDQTPLTDDQRTVIARSCFNLFAKRLPTNSYSGLVFAGYGDEDLLPSCASFRVEHLICEKLNFSIYMERSIDFNGASAAIVPFAQDDAVVSFMDGRHPLYHQVLSEEAEVKLSEKDLNELLDNVRRRNYELYTMEILRTVTSLPKEDLAIVAETMVNLTSFMRKVQMQLETVGGPVDIALISKKDGFVWVKRKHYFTTEFNPHFLTAKS